MAGLEIELDKSSWKSADLNAVKRILYETAHMVYCHLKGSPSYRILVEHSQCGPPMAYFRRHEENFYRVKLTNYPLDYKCQIMYQFAHEFCHIVSDHNRLVSTVSKNGWFHESLCELASIFTMRESKSVEYVTYVDELCLSKANRMYEEIDSANFGSWLAEQEKLLRGTNSRTGYCRELNAVVAYRLYPVFAMYPEIWNVVRYLPKSDSGIQDYCKEWQGRVRNEDKHLVDLVSVTLLHPVHCLRQ